MWIVAYLMALSLSSEGEGLSVTSAITKGRLQLPLPPIPYSMDTSLSAKLIRAFYEVNFVSNDELHRPSNAAVSTMVDKSQWQCSSGSASCKFFYYVPAKGTDPEKIDGYIKEIDDLEQFPVYKEARAFTTSTHRNPADSVVSLVKNKTEDGDVPVYKGTVNTDDVLSEPSYGRGRSNGHGSPGYPEDSLAPGRPLGRPRQPYHPPPYPEEPPAWFTPPPAWQVGPHQPPPACLHGNCGNDHWRSRRKPDSSRPVNIDGRI